MSKAYLILSDGTIFEGKAMGATGTTIGETVFTTGMTGYIETLTDPSYYGQIITQTFPLEGNYGIIPEDFESKKSWVRGYIVREICSSPSNFREDGTLDAFLKEQNIIGIAGIDTRYLTKKLRSSGVMNGMIVSGTEGEKAPEVNDELLKKIRDYKIEKAVETVSVNGNSEGCGKADSDKGTSSNETKSSGEKAPHVVLWDFGAKMNIQRELEKRGCEVTVVGSTVTAEDILSLKPNALMLSNGPGDPAENTGIISEIRKLCERNKDICEKSNGTPLPIFGICLGHQMLSLARGATTSKLKYGHRGGNHPVKDTASGRVYITSQNHGYAVDTDSLPSYATMSFFNVNDETCEGIRYTDIPAFSVQFHPEACGGPHDTNFLFDDFIEMTRKFM